MAVVVVAATVVAMEATVAAMEATAITRTVIQSAASGIRAEQIRNIHIKHRNNTHSPNNQYPSTHNNPTTSAKPSRRE
jgi:hypothetical protein